MTFPLDPERSIHDEELDATRAFMLDRAPHVEGVLMFRGLCETCTWEGPERTSNLRALADYDRHCRGRKHAEAEWHQSLAEALEESDDD